MVCQSGGSVRLTPHTHKIFDVSGGISSERVLILAREFFPFSVFRLEAEDKIPPDSICPRPYFHRMRSFFPLDFTYDSFICGGECHGPWQPKYCKVVQFAKLLIARL